MQSLILLSALGLLVAFSPASARAADGVEQEWDRSLFDYRRPASLIVEQTTPTEAQINFFIRPPTIPSDAADPQSTGPAKPRTMAHANIIHLQFRDAQGDLVPALLCTPQGQPGPFPLVIATHGLFSNKMQVCCQVGPALLKHGYAILAADLPCHGERPGNPLDMVDARDFQKSFPLYQKAVIDTRQLIDLASQLPQLDCKNGVVLIGYSLGSWVSSVVGPSDDRVKAMVLMVGGAFPTPPALLKIPRVAAVDPRIALSHFAGRPLLLLNGRRDDIVIPEWSKRLYAACPQPKKQIWYDSGHLLPAEAFEDAAVWIDGVRKAGALRR